MKRRSFAKLILAYGILGPSGLGAMNRAAHATKDTEEPFRIAFEDVQKVKRKYRRREVPFDSDARPGSIVIDTRSKFLYFVLENGRALRYGIGVGRQGFEWSGRAVIQRKAKWPRWTPPKEMVARDKLAARWANGMPGGAENPLGARALYLFQGNVDTLYRIHGTFQPETIGKAVSSGCIRMINADVVDLYERVRIGAEVTVLSEEAEVAEERQTRRRRFLFDFDR